MALSFNGSSSKIVGPTSSTFDFAGSTFTVAARIKTTSTQSGAIIAKGSAASGTGAPGWALAFNNSTVGSFRFFAKSGNTNGTLSLDRFSSSSSYNDGAWHSVVAEATIPSIGATSTAITFFIDGAYNQATIDTTFWVNLESYSSEPLAMGTRSANIAQSSYLNGEIADVGLWSGSLSDGEKASYCKGFAPDRIRPQNLLTAPRLVRDVMDVKGLAWTATSVTATAHPRTIS
jgi:hypothetical protein